MEPELEVVWSGSSWRESPPPQAAAALTARPRVVHLKVERQNHETFVGLTQEQKRERHRAQVRRWQAENSDYLKQWKRDYRLRKKAEEARG